MLSMGFEPDIRALAAALNKDDLQTMLFTATWPKAVQAVAFDLLKPTKVKITVGSGGTKLTANTAIKQVVTVVSEQNKWQKFLECMDDFRPHGPLQNQKVIVFCNTKTKAVQSRKILLCLHVPLIRDLSQRPSPGSYRTAAW